MKPADGIPWLARTLVDRVLDRYDAVALFTGEERVSKSTGIMRTIQEVERITGTPWAWDALCYGARPLVAAYRSALHAPKAVVGKQIWFDEGGRGLFAGETLDPEQVVIVKTLQQAGVANVILYIATPDIWEMAKRIRGRRAVFWVDVDSRGTPRKPAPSHAVVNERDRRRHYRPSRWLGFSVSRRCPELTYAPYRDDDPFWTAYEPHKLANLDGWLEESDAILDRHEAKLFGKGHRAPNYASDVT